MKTAHSICFLLSLILAATTALAVEAAGSGLSISATPASLLHKHKDGSQLLKSMLEKARSLNAYSFDSILLTKRNGKEVVETGKLYFKSPNLIRFEVEKAGKRSGAVVVRQADGKIRGKMGGILGKVKVTLSPDSKLLKTANDFSVLDSDLESLLSLAVKQLGPKQNCYLGKCHDLSGQIIELFADNGSLLFRIIVDPDKCLPQEWLLFKNKQFFSTVKFANLTALNDLPDSLFRLEGAMPDETLASAYERGIGAAVDYELKLKQIEASPFSCELLANELGDFGQKQPAEIRDEVARISFESLRKSVQEILALPVADESGAKWNEESKRKLVFSATQIELLLNAMDHSGLNIDHAKLDHFRHAVWNLIDQLDFEKPQMRAIAESKLNLLQTFSVLEKSGNQY